MKSTPIKRPNPGWTCQCGQKCDPHWRFCGRCEAPKPTKEKENPA